MKSILQSIKPQYCELIASGKKTIEVRKTRPKLDVPFKVYVYCTKSCKPIYLNDDENETLLNGKVIGEYVCDEIQEITADNLVALYFNNPTNETRLTDFEMRKYANGKNLFLWHISDLVIYDKPKELGEFYKACNKPKGTDCSICRDNREQSCWQLTHPPQSWCYVEGLQE